MKNNDKEFKKQRTKLMIIILRRFYNQKVNKQNIDFLSRDVFNEVATTKNMDEVYELLKYKRCIAEDMFNSFSNSKLISLDKKTEKYKLTFSGLFFFCFLKLNSFFGW